MTHSSRSRSGNALLIILIITGALLVFSGVGFVVWKQFFNAPTTETMSAPKEEPIAMPPPPPTYLARDETLGSGLVIEYPEGWTNVHTGAEDPLSTSENQIDTNTLSSPTGEVQVLMTVEKNSQIGGLCSNDYIKLKYLAADTLPRFTGARFAAYVVYYPNTNFYQYHVGAQKNTAEITAVTTDNNSACRFMYSEYIDRTSTLPGAPTVRALLAVRFPAVGQGNNLRSGYSEAQVIERLSGPEYEQAKEIVQSLSVSTD